MKSKKINLNYIIGIFLLSMVLAADAQNGQFNPLYFGSPVDYDFKISGNFCELRETHFHAGIDIKPPSGNGPTKIYSIADGYVSRIRVSFGGYGRAVYIDHPDVGYTSVYGHLDAFSNIIEQIVYRQQISDTSFEMDFHPEPHVLPVKKGDFIGYMGNAGHSFGKHLHLEIRDTKTEKAVNPMLFGYHVEDKISPEITSVYIHALDEDGYVLDDIRIQPDFSESDVSELDIPIEVSSCHAGLALQMYDRASGANNKLGIYSLHMYVDDSLHYSYHLDKLSFYQSRNIIGFYDYRAKIKENKTIALCYKYPGNDLEFLAHSGSGIIDFFNTDSHHVRVVAEDFNKNRKSISFLVKKKDQTITAVKPSGETQKIKVGEIKSLSHQHLTVHFKANTLFRNIDYHMSLISTTDGSEKYKIHDVLEPIKTPIYITIKPAAEKSRKKDKAIIIGQNHRGTRFNYGGKWDDDALGTKIREFGIYYFSYDTIAPAIKPVYFPKKGKVKKSLRFSIKDNLPVRGEFAKEIVYKVLVNNEFVICPYSSKTAILEVPVDAFNSGVHNIRIEVTDHSGNTAFFDGRFIK